LFTEHVDQLLSFRVNHNNNYAFITNVEHELYGTQEPKIIKD